MAFEQDEASDERLMLRYQRGNRDAFVELVGRYHERMYNCALGILGRRALAEAVTEAAFLRLVKNATDFKHEERLVSWLSAIVVELCRTPLEVPAKGSEASTDAPPARDERSEMASAVLGVLASLPTEAREVFVLQGIAGLRLGEIARAAVSDDASVRNHLRLALDRLHEALESYEEYQRALR